MKLSFKKLLALAALLISSGLYSQLEIQIGRSQPIGGFGKKTGFEQAGYGKQGTCFQLNAMGEDGALKLTMSVFAAVNKFDLDAYEPQFLEANKTNTNRVYTKLEVGKYFSFGFALGPEYRLPIGDNIIIPIRAHVGTQVMMPPLKFNAYYTEVNYAGQVEESYDNIGGSWVYEVLGLNYRLGTGFGYKMGSTTLMARVDYNNRFLAGQMTYGGGKASSTYPKKFTNIDLNVGFAFGFD